MARNPKAKPKLKATKAMAAALEDRKRDLAAVNLPADGATLRRQDDVEITRSGKVREGRKVDADSARRTDAFAALRKGLARGCYDAARRFETDVLTRLGQSEGLAGTGRVDCTAGHTTDLMRTAGIAVDQMQKHLPPRDFWLLMDLIAPPIDRGTWRDHAAHITGEQHPEAQAAAVRATLINLRDAYAAMERDTAAERLARVFDRKAAA